MYRGIMSPGRYPSCALMVTVGLLVTRCLRVGNILSVGRLSWWFLLMRLKVATRLVMLSEWRRRRYLLAFVLV